MDISKIIKNLLIQKGIKENIYIYSFPSGKEGVKIISTGGYIPDNAFRYPSIQITARFKNNSYEILESIYNILKGTSEEVINGIKINYIEPRQEPFFLFQQEDGSLVYVCNFSLIIEHV